MAHPRTALVTGAAQGIGRAIAAGLVGRGLTVVLADVNTAENAATAAELGTLAHAVTVDLADTAALLAMADAAAAEHGAIDVLVNNAGVTSPGSLWDVTVEEWDTVLATNLRATFLLSRALGAGMRDRGWGRIVNLASVAGQTARPTGIPYGASKAGIIALTRAFALELSPHGVTVNAIAPGVTDTPMLAKVDAETVARLIAEIPVGHVVRPDAIAALVGFLISEDGASVTGATFDVNGGALMR